jgi:hypothetical protein
VLLLVVAIAAWWERVHVVRHERARARPHRAGLAALVAAGALAVAVIAYPWQTLRVQPRSPVASTNARADAAHAAR